MLAALTSKKWNIQLLIELIIHNSSIKAIKKPLNFEKMIII